jgi:hypothetical protein
MIIGGGDEEDSMPERPERSARGGPLGLKPPKGVAVKPVFAVSIVLGKKAKPGAEKKKAKGGRVPSMPSMRMKPRRLATGGRVEDPHLRGGANDNARYLGLGGGCANNNAAHLGPGGGCVNNNAAHLGPGGGCAIANRSRAGRKKTRT